MAINRDAIRDRIMDGLSSPSSHIVPPPLRDEAGKARRSAVRDEIIARQRG